MLVIPQVSRIAPVDIPSMQAVLAIRRLGAALGRLRGERWEELDNGPATAPPARMDGQRAERGESVTRELTDGVDVYSVTP
jgi:hypothetical protein